MIIFLYQVPISPVFLSKSTPPYNPYKRPYIYTPKINTQISHSVKTPNATHPAGSSQNPRIIVRINLTRRPSLHFRPPVAHPVPPKNTCSLRRTCAPRIIVCRRRERIASQNATCESAAATRGDGPSLLLDLYIIYSACSELESCARG